MLCASCYNFRRKNGVALPPRLFDPKPPRVPKLRQHGEDVMAYIERRVTKDSFGCWNWPKPNGRYPQLVEGGRMRQISHVVLERKLGRPLADGMIALHSCDNRVCVNAEHLREGTYKDNTADMFARGRFILGKREPRPLKLTADAVRDIKAARIIKRSPTDGAYALARRYDISIGMLWKIRHGKAWTHVA